MLKAGVLPLNIVISCFYVVLGAFSLVVLKKACKKVTRFERPNTSPSQWFKQDTNYNKMFAISWLKKYTIPGGFFLQDKKYLLKQFFFVGVYAVSCLGINKTIIWPVALGTFLLPAFFIIWDLVLKKVEAKRKEVGQNKVTHQQQPQSQIDIDPGNALEPTITIIRPIQHQESVKLNTKSPRGLIQKITISAFCFGGLVMMMQTVMTIGTSISNSGQLNLLSVLLIMVIDQFAIRLTTGVLLWVSIKLFTQAFQINQQESSLFCLVCFEDITDILIQKEEERIKKAIAMTASPPKKKTESPSRVPKANTDKPIHLNLINLEPTKRQGEQPLQEIYLTTAQKDLFQGHNGFYTKRSRHPNRDHISFSAQKGTTIDCQDSKDCQDILVLKDDPFDIENHPSGDFYLQESGIRGRRRRGGAQRRRNRRNLQLTGTSPYLEYLPDMLKKVDKYKGVTANKEKKVL